MLVDIKYSDACFPKNDSEGNAGYDLFSREAVFIQRGTGVLVPLGIWTAFPNYMVALLWDRSGLSSKHDIHRFAGVIDSNYRGEWMVKLFNHSDKHYQIKKGDRVCQVLFQQVLHPKFIDFNKSGGELPESDREGGFGGSGR
jgi:dUTP pyrophosphatase